MAATVECLKKVGTPTQIVQKVMETSQKLMPMNSNRSRMPFTLGNQ
jgi:hypothetical protein